MKKKLTVLFTVLALAMTFALAACGGDGNKPPKVTISAANITVEEGGAGKIAVTASSEDFIDEYEYAVEVGKETVISVDKRGNVVGLNPGTATVSVTGKDSGLTATCTVTVTAIDHIAKFNSMGTFEAGATVASMGWTGNAGNFSLLDKETEAQKEKIYAGQYSMLVYGGYDEGTGGSLPFDYTLGYNIKRVPAGTYTLGYWKIWGADLAVAVKVNGEAVTMQWAEDSAAIPGWSHQVTYITVEQEKDLNVTFNFATGESLADVYMCVDNIALESGKYVSASVAPRKLYINADPTETGKSSTLAVQELEITVNPGIPEGGTDEVSNISVVLPEGTTGLTLSEDGNTLTAVTEGTYTLSVNFGLYGQTYTASLTVIVEDAADNTKLHGEFLESLNAINAAGTFDPRGSDYNLSGVGWATDGVSWLSGDSGYNESAGCYKPGDKAAFEGTTTLTLSQLSFKAGFTYSFAFVVGDGNATVSINGADGASLVSGTKENGTWDYAEGNFTFTPVEDVTGCTLTVAITNNGGNWTRFDALSVLAAYNA